MPDGLTGKRCLFSIGLAALLLAGCAKKTPETPETLQMIAGVRTAVSAKNPEWLRQWKAKIEQAGEANQLTEETSTALQGVVELAESGDWDSANRKIIRLQRSRAPEK
jgi:type IV pilus biogenesis protein CpaD/CtpE